jgi:hypothetical protein
MAKKPLYLPVMSTEVIKVDSYGQPIQDKFVDIGRVFKRLIDRPLYMPYNMENGPIDPDGFSWDGKQYHGLAKKPFLAIRYIWNQPNRSAIINDLAEPIWEDHEISPYENMVGGVRREINKFFRDNEIPLSATVKNGFLALIESQPKTVKARPAKKKSKHKRK